MPNTQCRKAYVAVNLDVDEEQSASALYTMEDVGSLR